ncbi:replication initiation protein [Providencia alcalifaciens]|uniref:replication initiation protein n=1 Tax=Providencia alcalifaciens TaxID=126385 RepID=UPI0032D9EFC1
MKLIKLENATSKTKVRHADDFNMSIAKLPIPAKRVLCMVLAQIANPKSKIDIEIDLRFEVTAHDYAYISNTDISVAYKALPKAVDMLLVSTMHKDISDSNYKKAQKINITRGAEYHYDEGYCVIRLNPDVYPYVSELSKNFTSQSLLSASRLVDLNHANLYQSLMKRISKRNTYKDYSYFCVIDIDELKTEMVLFDVDDKGNKIFKYEEFKQFNKMLKGAIKVISEKTEIKNLAVKIHQKRGRKAKSLMFTYDLLIDDGDLDSLNFDE